MSSQKKLSRNKRDSQAASGSNYHKEHASHVPDYGANTIDPAAKRMK